MNEQQFENLTIRWPDLFNKSNIDGMSIGPGWENIINTLCGFISYNADQARYRIKFYEDREDHAMAEKAREDLAVAISELPVIEQVKEKFGTLRFYINGGKQSVHNYIEFAEAMSGNTCEECGAPGVRRTDIGWIKTQCDVHYKESLAQNSI